MSETYKQSGESFIEFFNKHIPPLQRYRSTCVGLAYELIGRWHDLDNIIKGVSNFIILLSCEEAVKDVNEYVANGKNPESVPITEKDHVLVGLRVYVEGRYGVIIADPGYHIGKCITVMVDSQFPHSGWQAFVYEPDNYKLIHYKINKNNVDYVEWHERKNRHGVLEEDISLIYVGKDYRSANAVTERRNLVNPLKSLLSRGYYGNIRAGIYFRIRPNENQFTLITEREGLCYSTRLDFELFLYPDCIPQEIRDDIELCNRQLKFPPGTLYDMIIRLAAILVDEDYINEILRVHIYVQRHHRYRPRLLYTRRSGQLYQDKEHEDNYPLPPILF